MFQKGDKLIVVDISQNNLLEKVPFNIGDIVTCSYTTMTIGSKLKVSVTEYPFYEFFAYRFKKHDVPKWIRKEYKRGYG